jgi:hypothetical protein
MQTIVQHSIIEPEKESVDLAASLQDLQKKVARETDPKKTAELYEQMTGVLSEIQARIEDTSVDLSELKRVGSQSRIDHGIRDGMTNAQIEREMGRWTIVLKVIEKLPAELKATAARGLDEMQVISLDLEGAHKRGLVGRRCPTDRSHLHSPAFQKLWDHLAKLGLEPHLQSRWNGPMICDTHIYVRLPH